MTRYQNMFVRQLILIWFLAASFFALGQGSLNDSLLLDIENQDDINEKLQAQLRYASHLYDNSTDTALIYLDQLLQDYAGNDTAYGKILSQKSEAYSIQGNFKVAISIGLEALKLQKSLKDTAGIGFSSYRLARANTMMGKLDNAIDYLKSGLKMFQSIADSPAISKGYEYLGIVQQEIGNTEEAILRYKQSISIAKKLKYFKQLAYTYHNLASLYHNELEQNDSFNKYILLSVDTYKNKTITGTVPVMTKFALAVVLQNKHEYSKAIEIIKEGITESEAKKSVEVTAYGKEILPETYYLNEQYQEAADAYILHYAFQDSLDKINNAKDIAEIQEKYKNAENEVYLTTLKNENLEALNRIQNFRLIALFLSIVIALTGFLFYRKQQKNIIRASQLKAKLEEVKLAALRSQMNPHFLFNCINMAQNFILEAKKRDAYEYLEKFAKLLRNVLDKSTNFYIPLDEEINQLKLYLELESIRFKNGFSYAFDIDPQLENGVYEIPGMVLQPFFENALIHGIYNLEKGEGTIEISFKKNETVLEVEIRDNGVGRKKAIAIKKQKQKRYQSIAIPNITERLSIMRENNLGVIEVEIHDLYNDGIASGTLIQIQMPLN